MVADPGSELANTRYEAALHRRRMSIPRRLIALVLDLVASNWGTWAPFNIGRYQYRRTITDRRTGMVVEDHNWGGNLRAAQAALDEVQEDLATLSVTDFSRIYDLHP